MPQVISAEGCDIPGISPVMKKAVTIVGRGPSWKQCPFRTQELWGTDTCLITDGLKDKPWTRVYCFDDNDTARQCLAIAVERNIPFISTFPFATQPYPLMAIAREFQISYFKNSVSYAMAQAIYEDYTFMRLDGIDQGPGWLLQQGKPYITFWYGVAVGRKIDVQMGPSSLGWTYRVNLHGNPEEVLALQKPMRLEVVSDNELRMAK